MLRILYAAILSGVLVLMNYIAYGFGDATCTLETWIGSFVLPLWSLGTVSLWHDVGRFIWTSTFNVDSRQSTVSNDVRSLVFVLWMSIVLTYVVWVHISLFAVPLLLVLPFLGFAFRDFLLQDWTKPASFTGEQLLAVLFWGTSSYLVYWGLTVAWILLRVCLADSVDGGVLFYIK
jgi:hypothetical protein